MISKTKLINLFADHEICSESDLISDLYKPCIYKSFSINGNTYAHNRSKAVKTAVLVYCCVLHYFKKCVTAIPE